MLAEDICQVTDAALAAYNRMRSVEGVKLAEDIAGRADTIERTVARVEAQSPQTVSAYRERLESKMREVLASTTIDEARTATCPSCGICCGGMNPWAGSWISSFRRSTGSATPSAPSAAT